MSQTIVQNILEMIDQLSDADREVLSHRLEERAEAEWRLESEKARAEARAQGIGQDAIDEAIFQHRYKT